MYDAGRGSLLIAEMLERIEGREDVGEWYECGAYDPAACWERAVSEDLHMFCPPDDEALTDLMAALLDGRGRDTADSAFSEGFVWLLAERLRWMWE